MKIGIIGTMGHIGYVLPALQNRKQYDVVGIAKGRRSENIEPVVKKLENMGHRPGVFENPIDMLDSSKPDVAVVACVFGDHAYMSCEAFQRGIHVYTEKPAATTYEQFDCLKKQYHAVNVHFSAMFGLRHTPWFYTAQQMVSTGEIGDIRIMHAQKSYRLGTRAEHYRNRREYGGTIPWVGSHAVDWLVFFTGGRFLSVDASQSRKFNSGHGELEMHAACHFWMEDEISASVNIDYFRPPNAPSHGDDRLRVVGTKGILEVVDEKVFIMNEHTTGQKPVALQKPPPVFEDWIMQIQGKGPSLIQAADVFSVTQACLHAQHAADTGQKVFFDHTSKAPNA